MTAAVTLIDMAAENRCAADLDRMHDPLLFRVHAVGITLTINRTMQTKYVDKFEGKPVHRVLSWKNRP
jgi:hypothetical protein